MTKDELMALADQYAYRVSESMPSYDKGRAALEAALDGVCRDAARYRAIRDGLEVDINNSGIVVSLIDDFGGETLRGDNADAAIDAAMKDTK